ncbi:unnamed protein product [Didymodactylos carnosus]|uniref:Glucuronyl hydrolase n=1 Tax=Didymodactylos carnosus TaxID=1234261 RepID=A0A813ZYH0_9BILA|nr:unnamed protein product [Didymodactylos carnosus]CAF1421403.1 unnamed protein product [Didymodactylos carnosus]CAF3686360.1 unnamed protein product [Didymodactylos carnosus]CAF4222061.1 unnamed protein product [Didymodactylos carnosus]
MMRGILICTFLLSAVGSVSPSLPINDLMTYAGSQYHIVYNQWKNNTFQYYPTFGYPQNAEWQSSTATTGWTSGFFPGVMWNLYEYNSTFLNMDYALAVTTPTRLFANNTQTHDVGFVIMSGCGNAYRLLKAKSFAEVIIKAAQSLSTRYSPIVHCTRSWNSAHGFLVIIDNMMNLELLYEANVLTNNQTFYNIAFNHANRTMYEHFREDNSTYHVVEYNETDGNVVQKYTAQGYSNNSTWSRGQAWAIHGFTISYRYTRHQPFLDTAIGAANYFLSRLQGEVQDSVPYWDFDSPFNATYQPRDTSAASIIASALLELAQYVPSELSLVYLNASEIILNNLGSAVYLASGNKIYQLPAILVNGTSGPYHNPQSPAYDVAESYGDYYFTQALVRYSKLKQGKKLDLMLNASD